MTALEQAFGNAEQIVAKYLKILKGAQAAADGASGAIEKFNKIASTSPIQEMPASVLADQANSPFKEMPASNLSDPKNSPLIGNING